MVWYNNQKSFISPMMFAILALTAMVCFSAVAPSTFAESSNEALLADLSANMMQIPINEGLDYTIDCGPARDVINVEPKGSSASSIDGKFYCVMQMGDQTVFGTFTPLTEDSKESSTTILNTYKDIAYEAHKKSADIDSNACAYFNPDLDPLTFQQCKNPENKKIAIQGMYTYVYESPDTMFVVIAQKPIESFNRGFFDAVEDFFKRFFGIDTQENTLIDSDSSFEYGYFASKYQKNVSAKWSGTKATIIYQGFVTDISKERPEGSQYYKGRNERQILLFGEDMDMDTKGSNNENSVRIWKKYTSGLRLTDISGTPVAGDVCGDGYVGYDEDCEINASISEWKFDSCRAYDQAVYQAGELSCIRSGENACKFNTTSCISCRDEDNDGYSSGQGTSGSLKTLSSVKLGVDAPYGPFKESYTELLSARKQALGLDYEAMSISYDLAFSPSSVAEKQLDSAIEKANKQYAACVTLKPTKEVQCKNEAYSNETHFSYSISEMLASIMSSGYSGEKMNQAQDTTSQISYAEILSRQKADGVSPIVKINLGSSASKLPAQSSQYTAAQLDRTRAYCYSLAKGLSGKWASLEDPASHPKLNTYVVVSGAQAAGIGPNQYADLYLSCKLGIESAQNADVTVLYALPQDAAGRKDYLASMQAKSIPADGLFLQLDMSNDQYKDVVSEIAQTKLVSYAVISAPFDRSSNYGTRYVVNAATSNVKPIFSSNSEFSRFEYDDEIVTNATDYWTVTMGGLSGNLFSFDRFVSGKPIPQSMMVVFSEDGVSSKLSIHNYGPELKLNSSDLDLRSCGVIGVQYATAQGIVREKNFSYVVPANSVTVISLSSESSCLVGNKQGIAACKTAIDCNDSEAPVGRINPGATEWCADNIDNNCNGVVDEAGCSSSEPDPLGVIVCDYNGKCDDPEIGESRTLCSDCVRAGACPKAALVHTYGSVKILTRAGINNEPQLMVQSTDASCGGPVSMVFDTTAKSPQLVLRGYKTNNCGSSDTVSSVTVETLSGIWRFKKSGENVGCWNGFPAQLDVPFNQKPSCIPNGEKLLGEDCVIQADCTPGKGLYCTSGKCSQTASTPATSISIKVGTSWAICPSDPNPNDKTCFPAGTKIAMADGTDKNIEDVAIDDLVMSYDEKTGKQSAGKVLALERPIRNHECMIGFEDSTSLRLTNDHPLYANDEWKVIDLSTRKGSSLVSGQLAVGDKVLTIDGKRKAITSISCKPAIVQMYNLEEIEGNHNFYADGVLAHNSCRDLPEDPKSDPMPDPSDPYA